MKRKLMKSLICTVLVMAFLAAPMSALASSKLALILKVNKDWVYMRAPADEGGEVIGRLRKGTKLLYWGSSDGSMCKVLNSKGDIGYVYKDYLSTYGAMKKSSVCVTTDSTKLYKLSGGSLKGNGSLAKGKFVVVYKTSGNWAYVKTMSGKSAYCRTSTLERAFD